MRHAPRHILNAIYLDARSQVNIAGLLFQLYTRLMRQLRLRPKL